jgi:CMP-N,N'-diacetyllegionaminic acid synthase
MNVKILCTICARGGSKGLKNKNILKLNSKPLILHSIEQAKKIKKIKKIVVTSDSNKILKLTKKKVDLTILRPKKFSNDRSSKIEAIRHALRVSEKNFSEKFDLLIDLDVTSPLRSVNDINKALNFFLKNNFENMVSGCKARKNPFFNQIMLKNKKVQLVMKNKNYIRRQDAPKVFDLNASIYIWTREAILKNNKLINSKTGFFEMPTTRSIDIDEFLDLKFVEFIKNRGFDDL